MSRAIHESIVIAIRRAHRSDMLTLALLINDTKFPKDHDTIIEAWQAQKKALGLQDIKFGVEAHVKAEKLKVEEKAAADVGEGPARCDDTDPGPVEPVPPPAASGSDPETTLIPPVAVADDQHEHGSPS